MHNSMLQSAAVVHSVSLNNEVALHLFVMVMRETDALERAKKASAAVNILEIIVFRRRKVERGGR